MARERGQPVKLLRNDADGVMTASIAGSDVSRMKMGVVLHFDLAGRQGFEQPRANEFRAIRRHFSSTAFRERTTHRPCSRPNTRVRAVRPNSLKYTQVASLNE